MKIDAGLNSENDTEGLATHYYLRQPLTSGCLSPIFCFSNYKQVSLFFII